MSKMIKEMKSLILTDSNMQQRNLWNTAIGDCISIAENMRRKGKSNASGYMTLIECI